MSAWSDKLEVTRETEEIANSPRAFNVQNSRGRFQDFHLRLKRIFCWPEQRVLCLPEGKNMKMPISAATA